MNALNNKEVGEYINKYFVSSFQKVATFKIVNKQKQGGNVAAYFCAPDGRVLHCVAGPVNAAAMLREAKWVVETTQAAMKEAKNDGAKFKEFFRKAHAAKLKQDHGLVVQPDLGSRRLRGDDEHPLGPAGRAQRDDQHQREGAQHLFHCNGGEGGIRTRGPR